MRSRVSLCRLELLLLLLAGWFFFEDRAVAESTPASVNAITITVSPNPAKVKQKVTLTAKVTTDNEAATGGTVTFFDGKIQLANAQVVGKKPAKGYKTGTATLTTIVAPGSHSLTAVYGGTAKSPKIVRSKPVVLKITGKTGSTTKLAAKANAQHPKNYDFTASVHGLGLLAPQGTADITDITTNTDLNGPARRQNRLAQLRQSASHLRVRNACAVRGRRLQWRRFPGRCHRQCVVQFWRQDGCVFGQSRRQFSDAPSCIPPILPAESSLETSTMTASSTWQS